MTQALLLLDWIIWLRFVFSFRLFVRFRFRFGKVEVLFGLWQSRFQFNLFSGHSLEIEAAAVVGWATQRSVPTSDLIDVFASAFAPSSICASAIWYQITEPSDFKGP